MKKVFIGLLIIAAGTAAFLFYRQQHKAKRSSQTNQESIIGKWRIDSVFTSIPDDTIAMATLLLQNIPGDSLFKKTVFDFRQDGKITTMPSIDTSRFLYYSFKNDSTLLLKRFVNDSVGFNMVITSLDSIYLALRADDQSAVFFKRPDNSYVK